MPEPVENAHSNREERAREPAKLRLGGMALRNGLLVHGPTHWSAAVRRPDGTIGVASGRKPRLHGVEKLAGIRGVVRLGEAMIVIPLVKRALPDHCLAARAFLFGLSAEDLDPAALAVPEPDLPLIVAARLHRPLATAASVMLKTPLSPVLVTPQLSDHGRDSYRGDTRFVTTAVAVEPHRQVSRL